MALYFHFNETTGDLAYSDKEAYEAEGYASLGEQTNMNPTNPTEWVFDSKRKSIKTVSKDPAIESRISGLTSMYGMFHICSSLMSLDLSGFDTSQVTSMGYMFGGCPSMASLDLSGFDTSKVANMSYMFSGCSDLTSLDLSGFDTSKATNVNSIFQGCSSLASLDLSGFDTSKITSIDGVFSGCSMLRLIAVSDTMSNVLSQLPSSQYYPASGGDPVAKADLTAGTWVRDEADLSKVATVVEQAQAFAALRRDAGKLEKRIAALEKAAG